MNHKLLFPDLLSPAVRAEFQQTILRCVVAVSTLLSSSVGFTAGDSSNLPELCAKQKAFYLSQYKTRTNVDGLVQTIKSKSSQLIALGESHAESYNMNDGYYPIFLSQLKAAMPELDCAAVEQADSSFQSELPGIKKGQPADMSTWDSFLIRADQLGMKIFGIDKEHSSNGIGDLDLESRNEFMSQKIVSLLQSRTCHKIVVINGMAHLWNARSPSIPTRVAKAGFKTFSIIMLDVGIETPVFPSAPDFAQRGGWLNGGFVWLGRDDKPLCEELPGPVAENFAFYPKTNSLASQIPVYVQSPSQEAEQGTGWWLEFDAGLAIGCGRQGTDTCTLPAGKLPEVAGYLSHQK